MTIRRYRPSDQGAVIALFFAPALVAFLAETRKAMRAARLLDDTGRAFEPLVARPVLPTKPSEPDPPLT